MLEAIKKCIVAQTRYIIKNLSVSKKHSFIVTQENAFKLK